MSQMTPAVPDVPTKPTTPPNTDAGKKSPTEEIDVKTEFKSAIDETLSTVCQVASISELGQEGQQKSKAGKCSH